MSQIRVKALKGEGKTTSNKARKSGRASGTASPAGSDVLHRVFHQDDAAYRSEAEATPPETPPAYNDDDELMDGQMTPDDRDLPAFDPKKLIDELQDRKSNQNETRELLLDHYVKMLRIRYNDELEKLETDQMLQAFLRGATRGETAREKSLSLQAYSLTISIAHLGRFETSRNTVKQVLLDEDDEECKIQALYALTLTTINYGSGEDEVFDYLDFLVEAIQGNGETINALNKDEVMVALFECWAFSATQAEIWQQADYAMDAFVDKLESNDIETQTIAAECIAYIFEASRAHEQEEGEPFELPYDPARISSKIRELNQGSVKSMSRKNRRDLREGLRSVVTSLDKGVGPYYSTAQRASGKEVGYRFKLRKRGASSSYGQSALVESWHHFHRIALLRDLFGNGLERHIENETPMVMECLEGLDWNFVQKTDTRSSGGSTSYFDMMLDG
jgi:hypothetical protein